MADVIVQNKGPYDWRFVLFQEGTLDANGIHGTPEKEYIFLGKLQSPKNITLIPQDHWDRLQLQYPQISDFLKRSKDEFVILSEIPGSYYDATHHVAVERARSNALDKELKETKTVVESKDAEIERLKKQLESFGARVE
jgi:hypothetical protein